MRKAWTLSDYNNAFERHVELTFNHEEMKLEVKKWVEINEAYLDEDDEKERPENREDDDIYFFRSLRECKEFIQKLIFKMINKCFIEWVGPNSQNTDISRKELTQFLDELQAPPDFEDNEEDAMTSEEINEAINDLLAFYYEG